VGKQIDNQEVYVEEMTLFVQFEGYELFTQIHSGNPKTDSATHSQTLSSSSLQA